MKMKKLFAAALCLLILAGVCLPGCAARGKTLIKAGDEKISVNVFSLYLSRMKGSLASAGQNVNNDSFWQSYISTDNTTMCDYYTGQVFAGLKQIAAAMIMYDEAGLSLDKATEDSIDEWIESLIDEVGEGSKSTLNSILSAYGANITTLRDAAIIEAKLSVLKAHLYGEGGSLITDAAKEEYYQATYIRGYQMQLANYYYDHDKDSNGFAIYYTDQNYNHIAYDTTGEDVIKTEEKDQYGDFIYLRKNEDADDTRKLVAYDAKKGFVHYKLDKNGDRVKKDYTEAEMQLRYERATEIAKKCKGNEALFLQCMAEYSDNSEFNETYAPNGMYFSVGTYATDSIFSTFQTELAKLEEGELVVIGSDAGYYILMRAALDKGAFTDEANKRWFDTLTGLTLEHMLQKRTDAYIDRVWVDEELLKTVDITMVAANNYY